MFAGSFRKFVGKDNYSNITKVPFFTDVTINKPMSRFLCPMETIPGDKELLVLVFLICAGLTPETILRDVLGYTTPAIVEDDDIDTGSPRFLFDAATALKNKSLPELKAAVEKLAKSLRGTASSTSVYDHVIMRGYPDNVHQYQLIFSNPFPGTYRVFGLHHAEVGAQIFQCTNCKRVVNEPDAGWEDMKFEFYSTLSLDEFMFPKVGATWSSRQVSLRLKGTPDYYTCICGGNSYTWLAVNNSINDKFPPLFLTLKRYIPEVQPVAYKKGKVPIAPIITAGNFTFIYIGWSCRVGHVHMIPFLIGPKLNQFYR